MLSQVLTVVPCNITKLVAYHLRYNPRAKTSEYHMPKIIIAHELGLDIDQVERSLNHLEEIQYLSYDQVSSKVKLFGTNLPEPKQSPSETDKKQEIQRLLRRYDPQDQIKILQCWEAVATTRRSGQIATNIILNYMKKFDKLPIGQVMVGIDVYMNRKYYAHNKPENYLYGIMLNTSEEEVNKYYEPEKGYSKATESNIALLDEIRRERQLHAVGSTIH